ncbi:MAG: alanine-tRNA synthetase second additional domain-containing protein [Prevotellaceae bacterium]|nr:alanine-tRNA synthetase second additional domain-containing protein [Prevotella sp.]MDD7257309.1 alanine-tRNA synthetase second additional domain-containing protein [Prevotellaceae bacterium]MDY6131044.1 alanine-tRNA synthetase second additional domain-containing protein [Prevotella sp.]
MRNPIQQYLIASQYFAPRGKERLIFLGEQISQRHLHFSDRLIGIVGDAGSGKSSLIKGMFPGLELSNDDDIINPRKIMQARDTIALNEVREAATFHLDIRFMQGFLQMYEIADFIRTLLEHKRRVIIEHFNLIHPVLDINADLIVGIGEEIIVARPTMFGPLPESIYDIVHESLKYRKMAHSAEEITRFVLECNFGIKQTNYYFSDIRNGFVMKFYHQDEFDIALLESKVKEIIDKCLPISYYDEDHIKVGDRIVDCDGPRLQVKNTSEIQNFFLVKELIHDKYTDTYCLIGLVDDNMENVNNRNTQYFLKRDL